MAFNELEAAKMIDDGKLSDAEIKLLTRTRNGVAFDEVKDDKELNVLLDKGLVMLVNLSHPRADVVVEAVIPSDEGTTVLNLFDKRYRENANTSPDANTSPNAEPKLVKHPTEEEARKVPTLEAKPLAEKDRIGYQREDTKETKAAMKDPQVRTGAKDVSEANTEDRTVAKNATVKVEQK